MTLKEIVKIALENYDFNSDNRGLNEIIAYAYYRGKCKKSKELCDKARDIFTEQMLRAKSIRYKNTGMFVQGGVKILYDTDYDNWISVFADDEIKDCD